MSEGAVDDRAGPDGAAAGRAAGAVAWAESGVMALTGLPSGAPLVGGGLVAGHLERIVTEIAARTSRSGAGVCVDWGSMLSGRAAVLGLGRRGQVSANGSCRLLRSKDGWVGVSLARSDDWDAIPALVADGGTAGATLDGWAAVEAYAAGVPSAQAAGRARLLGIPAAPLRAPALGVVPGAVWRRWSRAAPGTVTGRRVVDLSSMWAGPLTARVLHDAGADVVKVESSRRHDGARSTPAFYRWLHPADDRTVSVDFGTAPGRAELRRLIENADIVIEASRPRALEQLGVGPETFGDRPGRIWLSITGYGRAAPGRDWVAFGDDAAVAGGLVAWTEDHVPVFCGDAIADPMTGLWGAALVLRSLDEGGGDLIDLALARTAAAVAAGPTWGEPSPYTARPAPGGGGSSPSPDASYGSATRRFLRVCVGERG